MMYSNKKSKQGHKVPILIITLAVIILTVLFGAFSSREVNFEEEIERKVEALLSQMTLEEKIGQMSQVRHFDNNVDDDITAKYLGSIIHTHGPYPGEDAAGWQSRFTELQKKHYQPAWVFRFCLLLMQFMDKTPSTELLSFRIISDWEQVAMFS
jgi:hypothetical protein